MSELLDTIVFPLGANATELIASLCAAVFSLFSSSVSAWEAGGVSFGAREAISGRQSAPALQALIVLSLDPDTIVFPSGEKATDMTQPLCALLFSLTSSRVAAWERGASQM